MKVAHSCCYCSLIHLTEWMIFQTQNQSSKIGSWGRCKLLVWPPHTKFDKGEDTEAERKSWAFRPPTWLTGWTATGGLGSKPRCEPHLSETGSRISPKINLKSHLYAQIGGWNLLSFYNFTCINTPIWGKIAMLSLCHLV